MLAGIAADNCWRGVNCRKVTLMNPERKAWLVLGAVYLASVAVAVNQAKVPPVMQVLVTDLKLDLTAGGWLMSALAVAGVFLGIPAALVFGKLGPRLAGLLALGCTVIGSIIGALANDAAALLLGRAVEGIGLGLIGVVAPAVISLWFPANARGTPLGIWVSWVPVGSFLMYNLAGPMLGWGWQGLWWFGAAFALIAWVVYAIVVSAPQSPEITTNGLPDLGSQYGQYIFNPASWMVGLVFAAFSFAFMAYSTWAPLYLHRGLGLSLRAASLNASLSSVSVIPATIFAGWLLDRVENRRRVLVSSLLVASVVLIASFQITNASLVVPYMLVLGLVAGFIPTTAVTLATETMPSPQLAGLALGIASVGQNLGLLFGPPFVGAMVADGNWRAGIMPLVLASTIGLGAAVWLQTRCTRKPASQ